MLAALACSLLLLSSQDSYATGKAPDGVAGFGKEPELHALRELFRDPTDEDSAFRSGLRDLIVDVRRELHQAQARTRLRGMMRLAPIADDSLGGLLKHANQLGRDPYAHRLGAEDALALTRLLSDGRLLAYGPLIEAAEEEIPDLYAALDILHGHAHGLVDLDPGAEAASVTARADLAAARLRAVLSDLREVALPLHERGKAPKAELLRVASGIASRDSSTRRDFVNLRDFGRKDKGIWRSNSALTRFDQEHAQLLGDRRRNRSGAKELADRLPQFLPIYDGQREVPEAWAEMSAAERARLAVKLAGEALAGDPLSDKLSYLMALGIEFSSGKKAAQPYFDRFLILQGIRHYDHKSFLNRELDPFQEYALVRISDWRPGSKKK